MRLQRLKDEVNINLNESASLCPKPCDLMDDLKGKSEILRLNDAKRKERLEILNIKTL